MRKYAKPRALSPSHASLFKNTVMLYTLLFSSYFFSFVTIPYQTRILGPEIFGKLGFAAAVMVFFQLLIDFGFMLSATGQISEHRDDKIYIKRLFSAVIYIKLALFLCSILGLIILFVAIPSLASDWTLYALYLLAVATASFLPDFVYRGFEEMTQITLRTVVVRFVFACSIFVFLNEPDDYHVVPLLLLLGNIIALAWAYRDMKRRFQITLVGISMKFIKNVFHESAHFFYSRIATTVYGAGNMVVLGAVNPGPAVGYYSAADKLITTARNAMSPIADSTYPYMIRHRDFKLIRKILILSMPVIIAVGTMGFIFAEEISVLLLGRDFAETAPILRALLPIAVMTLPSYLLGFPTLGAMGLAKHANNSIIFAAVAQLGLLLCLFISGNINAINLAVTATITEAVVLFYRVFVVLKNKERMLQ